jgi:hypothetical protein
MDEIKEKSKMHITALKEIILDILKNNSQGLRNVEIKNLTGIDVETNGQTSWLPYSLLDNLQIENKVEKIGEGKNARYFIKQATEVKKENMKKMQELANQFKK